MKGLLSLMLSLIVLFVMALPREKYNGHNTDYRWYNNKYHDIWELQDSTIIGVDTIFTYKLCGQKFKFNQKGEKL